jgi:arylsulfatase A-like enzyme/tetratricopeptide (TPR) repeat protein
MALIAVFSSFRRLLACVALVLPVLVGCTADPEDPAANAVQTGNTAATSVLLVTLDTTRADRLDPYGADEVQTPALAGLAANGVVFEQASAVAPVTAPTHASLLTGLYPHRHGVRDNAIHTLAEDIPTLAERLSAAGLRTAAFVSAAVLERRFGFARGFELYDDDLAASGARAESRMMIERSATDTVDRALAWLDGLPQEDSFFLWVHLFDPHAPYAPPPEWADRYASRPYDGEIAFMDSEIGRLLRHPRIAEPEVVVAAIGDHGESLGEHGELTHGLLVYESTMRVPWIMRWPACPPGQRVEAAVSQVDFVPTVLGLLASSVPVEGIDGVDGRNLLPYFERGEQTTDRVLYGESLVGFFRYGWSPLRVLRDGWLKLIDGPVPEIYDLGADPRERDDLARDRRDDLSRLQAMLEDVAAGVGGGASQVPGGSVSMERLRALGYVAGEAARPLDTARGNPMGLITIHEEIQRSATLLEAGQVDDAVRMVEAVLDRDPDNITALHDLTRGLLELGRLDDADRAAGRARDLAPWSARAPMVQAEVAIRRGDVERALELADESLAIDPSHQNARLERARYLALLGRDAEAAREMERVRESAGSSAWIELRYAELVELPRGELGQAEERLRSAVARDPFLAEAWLLLGTVLERQSRAGDAVAAYRTGLEHRPGHRELESQLALALAGLGQVSEAESLWLSRVREDPGAAQAWHNLASLAIQRGDWSEVERLARKAVDADPGSSEAWNNLGIGLEELGRTDEAETAYRRAVETGDAERRALFNLGLLLRESGRYVEAADVQRQVVAAQPSHLGARFELGVLLVGPLREVERGKAHLRAVIDSEPNGPRAAQARAILERLP